MKTSQKFNENFHLVVVIAGIIVIALSAYTLVTGFSINSNTDKFRDIVRIIIYSFITIMSFRIYKRLRSNCDQTNIVIKDNEIN